MKRLATFCVALAWALHPGHVHALSLEGEKTISLVDQEGERYPVAQVVFTPAEAGSRYETNWRDGVFADHFLSMRPFKCL